MNTSAHRLGRFCRLALGALQALVLALVALATGQAAAAPVVAGDLIVKFRDSSAAGAALAAVLAGSRPLASAAPVAARLSRETGVPLTLVQVTSGREALLAIDRAALLRSLAQRAAREPGVARATVLGPAVSGLPSELASVRIELKPPASSTASAQALADRLGSGELLRPRLSTDASGTMLLSYDIAGLTLALLARLGQHADIEYAQANRLLRPADPNSPR
jgi:hypothetical protein